MTSELSWRGDAGPLLDGLFEAAPFGLALLDKELRFVRVNRWLAAMHGVSPEQHVGRPAEDLLPSDSTEIVRSIRRVLATGRSVENLELRTQSDGNRDWLVSYYPVRDAGGVTRAVAAAVSDITERKLAEAERDQLLESRRRQATWSAFLSRAGVALADSLDYERTLQTVAELAVPALADWAFVEIVQPDRSIRRVAIAHADPAKSEMIREFDRRYPLDPDAPEGSAKVIRTGRAELVPELPEGLLEQVAIDEEHLRLLRGLGFKSHLIVPLRARGRVLGDIALVSAESGRTYGDEDLLMAEELAYRSALAIDNARLYTEANYIAETLQRSLLPQRLPSLPGVETAVRYRAAGEALEVGGDFYDLFRLPGSAVAIAIGDVAGKGVDAAAVTSLARHTMRATAAGHERPSEVLLALNEALLRELPPRRYLTCAYGRLVLGRTPTLSTALGGHPVPLILRADGSVEAAGVPGTLLGFVTDPAINDCEVRLEAGDAVLFYTDGVTEARGPEGFLGEERLEQLLASCRGLAAEEIAERIASHVIAFEQRPRDDLALLVLRIAPAGTATA